MKLGSLKAKRDGELIVMSKDLKTAARADGIAPTMQALLDDWDTLAPKAEALYAALNGGRAQGAFALDKTRSRRPCREPTNISMGHVTSAISAATGSRAERNCQMTLIRYR